MKQSSLLLLSLILTSSTSARRPKKIKPTNNEISIDSKSCSKKEIAQAVLAGTAVTLGSVGNIIKDPHDPHNVSASVASMIAGIVNITVAALQNRSIDLSDENELKQHLIKICQPLCEHITEMVLSNNISVIIEQ